MQDDPIRHDRRPLYERAQAAVIARIVQGVYKPGDQLPPEDQLAAGLGVSRTTIRSASGNLETLGYIQRVHVAGLFVTQRRFQVDAQLDALESFHPRLAARGRAFIADHAPGDPRNAGRRRNRGGAGPRRRSCDRHLPYRRDRYRSCGIPRGLPAGIHRDCRRVAGELPRFGGRLLRRPRRTPCRRWSDSHLGAARDEAALAALLHVAKGSTLLRLDEGFFTADGALVSWSRNYIVPEIFKFHIRRRVIDEDAGASV